MEAAAAEGKAASAASGSSQGRNNSNNNKRRKAGASPARDPKPSVANSRAELHEKLQLRIDELREERKRRQTEDAKVRKEAYEAKGGNVSKKAQPSPGEVPRVRGEDEERPEAGRLSFDTNSAGLPFEAGIGRRGKKVRKLRDDLRKHEVDATRLREAEARGEGDVFRKEQAVQKALQRARGEKVHDDSSKLRKVQKAMDLKKKKGKDKWTAKIESEKQQVNEQQAQRRDNLKNRGSKKKTKRAGFEGKKTGYLNTDDK